MKRDCCVNYSVVDVHCSESVEYLAVQCRPYYLLREFSVIIIIAVYIHPRAKAESALNELYETFMRLLTINPEG